MSKKYFTYIVTNHSNSVLYTGVTNNMLRRVFEHKTGTFKSSFSAKYKLYKLVWFQEFNDVNEALNAEKIIKGWRREKKIDLIKDQNPEFENLVKGVF